MEFRELTLRDKELFSRYLGAQRHGLAVYAFENIYIWRKLYTISWAILEGHLCVFFKDSSGSFAYLNPLGQTPNPKLVEHIFRLLNRLNNNSTVSRIENVEENSAAFYQGLGYFCDLKSHDYLYRRSDVARLSGERFKSQRASRNYFNKHFVGQYQGFSREDSRGCLLLYDAWQQERKRRRRDPLYQWMLEDSRKCLVGMLEDYQKLELVGRVVKIDKALKAFSFGYRLSRDTFCILYEVADLSIKGLAQYIFSQFCRELEDYDFINAMDDSGLENLKKVKLSYHPLRLVPAYIVTQK
jgi:uncharacterized protein